MDQREVVQQFHRRGDGRRGSRFTARGAGGDSHRGPHALAAIHGSWIKGADRARRIRGDTDHAREKGSAAIQRGQGIEECGFDERFDVEIGRLR